MAKFNPMELIGEIHGKFSSESEYYAAEKSKKWFPTNKWLFGNPEQPLFCIPKNIKGSLIIEYINTLLGLPLSP